MTPNDNIFCSSLHFRKETPTPCLNLCTTSLSTTLSVKSSLGSYLFLADLRHFGSFDVYADLLLLLLILMLFLLLLWLLLLLLLLW